MTTTTVPANLAALGHQLARHAIAAHDRPTSVTLTLFDEVAGAIATALDLDVSKLVAEAQAAARSWADKSYTDVGRRLALYIDAELKLRRVAQACAELGLEKAGR